MPHRATQAPGLARRQNEGEMQTRAFFSWKVGNRLGKNRIVYFVSFQWALVEAVQGLPLAVWYLVWGSWGQTEYENFLSCHTGILFLLVVVQSPTQARHCSLMDCSTPGLPVCPSPSPEVCPSSCSCTCDAISFSDALFSFCPQSFPASGTFLMSQLFTSGDQNTGACFSISPFNEYSGLISLYS